MIPSNRISDLIAKIEAVKSELIEAKYKAAAKLLAMASLEMRLQNHAISDFEFKEYCKTLEQMRTARSQSRPRKNSPPKRPATALRVIKLNFSGQSGS